MIARSFIFAAGIFLLYNLALLLTPPLRERFHTQSQWQTNLVRVQDYALAPQPKLGVMVGSSLGARLSPTVLDVDFQNLSLISDGPFTGLEVLKRNAAVPRILLIETNLLMRDENPTLLDNAFRPLISQLRPWLPALQERYQPANFLAGEVGERALHRMERTLERIAPPSAPVATSAPRRDRSEELFAAGLAKQQAATDVPLDPAAVQRHVAKLKAWVAEFERRGTRCIFVEMPTHVALMNLRQPAQIRAALQEAFPERKYLWVKPEQDHRYATTDGAHLTEGEAKAYAARIRTEVARQGALASSAAVGKLAN